ncbi:MAG: hypothetical protein KatS3mg085_618 [Candidatus Dojkabacteria bacterium]|nr:MAG: hypothetical protein KatS3mg085_618 [Candidatus Dojkabacteria bacterium]
MKNFSIIKIPLHLIPLFIEDESLVYSEYFSADIIKVFEKINVIDKKSLMFNKLKNIFNLSYKYVEVVNSEGEYGIKGDTITAWLKGYSNPVRINFWGEECESIELLNNIDFKKLLETDRLILLPDQFDLSHIKIQDNNTDLKYIIFTNQIIENEYIDAKVSLPALYFGRIDLLQKDLIKWNSQNYKIYTNLNLDKIPKEIQKFFKKFNLRYKIENDAIKLAESKKPINIQAGFIDSMNKIVMLSERETFGTISIFNKNYGIKNKNISKLLEKFEGKININDYVVHEDYGVGLYKGLEQQFVNDSQQEYIVIEYKHGDTVYVPIHQLSKISKYIGQSDLEPELSTLGTVKWKNLKKKVKAETRKIAMELIEHFAKRELAKAKPISIVDDEKYNKFVDNFQFDLTDDQKKAIFECEKDISTSRPMNRLLIGDVGFGKTEVILRIAYRVVFDGVQVLILAPTTVLVAQHYKTFFERFKNTGFKVDFLSRFKNNYENKEVINKLKNGEIDIVIGTHRLLSNDVDFKNLGLIVVDEEQKFGVKQKEKIKKLNLGAHLLSVSATPIPRTLSMALSSIQDLSIITTPPPNRKSIKTFLIKKDWNKIINAINFEIERGGQVYFVHNYINSIYAIEQKLKKFLPKLRVRVAHGQMKPEVLDKVMFEFYSKKFDLLLSTTIIENGLDNQNVNTIIIDKAEKLGLSQLYQLRGRVGRGDMEAFCYLFYSGRGYNSSTNNKYLERLQTIIDNQELGSGYNIASKDLEIRGAGNLLGKEQHGYINTIGYALYIQMLSQEIERLKSNV